MAWIIKILAQAFRSPQSDRPRRGTGVQSESGDVSSHESGDDMELPSIPEESVLQDVSSWKAIDIQQREVSMIGFTVILVYLVITGSGCLSRALLSAAAAWRPDLMAARSAERMATSLRIRSGFRRFPNSTYRPKPVFRRDILKGYY